MPRFLPATVALAAALVTAAAAPAAAAPAPALPPAATSGAFHVLAGLGYDDGWRVERHPRVLADLTGDGKADIVAFGDAGVWTAIATGDGGFTPAHFVLQGFGHEQGWRVGRHPRFVTDIDGDGRADIVGVGEDSIQTALSAGDGSFGPVQSGGPFSARATAAGSQWFAADVDADDRTDLMVLNNDAAHLAQTSLSLGNGLFGAAHTATPAYDFTRFDAAHFRFADTDGNKRAEILALQVSPSIRNVSSVQYADLNYFTPQPSGATFPAAVPSPPLTPPAVADVTGDGKADLVAFGTSVGGTWVAQSLNNGFFRAYAQGSPDYGQDFGWTESRTPRVVGDITGPDATGRTGDIVGFGDDGVWTSLSLGGGRFTPTGYVIPDFGYQQGWRVEQHPRTVADITGDGRADVVGFGNAGVYTAVSRGDGTFVLPEQKPVPDVRELSPTVAAATLQAAGLAVGRRTFVLARSCEQVGLVVQQSPLPGTPVDAGTPVDLWVATRAPRVCP